MRGGVWGGVGSSTPACHTYIRGICDLVEYLLDGLLDLLVSESENADTMAQQMCLACGVFSLVKIMDRPIQFHYQLRFRAIKIYNKSIYCVLAAKPQALQFFATQPFP